MLKGKLADSGALYGYDPAPSAGDPFNGGVANVNGGADAESVHMAYDVQANYANGNPVSPLGQLEIGYNEAISFYSGGLPRNANGMICAKLGVYPADITKNMNFTLGVLPVGITFTRASVATYYGENRKINYAAVNEPRFEYDADGLPLGLLLEPARTNMVIQSNVPVNQAGWSINLSATGTTGQLIPNAGEAPDGTLTAARMIVQLTGTTASDFGTVQVQGIVTTVGLPYVMAVWLKSYNGGQQRCRIAPAAGGSNLQGDSNILVTPTWQRFLIGVASASGAGINLRITLRGDLTDQSCDILIWGAQQEQAASSTSLIPTAGAAATRAVDNAIVDGVNFSTWFEPAEGTVYINSTWENYPADVAVTAAKLVFSDGTANNEIAIRSGGTPFATFDEPVLQAVSIKDTATIVSGGVNQATMVSPNAVTSGPMRDAVGFKLNNYMFVSLGGTPIFDTSGLMPVGLTQLKFGSAQVGMWLKQFTYSKIRLGDTQIYQFTAPAWHVGGVLVNSEGIVVL